MALMYVALATFAVCSLMFFGALWLYNNAAN